MGYVLRITGGNDKQGFPMKQGILTNGRVRLLLNKNHSCYRPRRAGERKRKSVRGCIVDGNLSVLSMAVIKKGEAEIPGLTDNTIPRFRGSSLQSCFRGRDTGLPLRGGGVRRTGWLPLSTLRSWPRGKMRPRRQRNLNAGGLLLCASPRGLCPASKWSPLFAKALQINKRVAPEKK